MIAVRDQWTMLRDAIAADRARPRLLRDAEDGDFLPAAVEVIERPVSPTLRTTAWLLMAGLALTVLWAVFGRIDIVAAAPGKLVPADSVKLVQPAEPGIVRAIRVREGQHVVKGQVLVELDPTVSDADALQAREDLAAAELRAAEGRAVLSALNGNGFAFVAPPGTSAATAGMARSLARATLDNFRASVAMRVADSWAASAARAEALTQAAKLDETLPILDEQIAANEALLSKGYVSKLRVLEMRRQRLSTGRDRDAAVESARRAAANVASADGGIAETRASTRSQILTDVLKADAEARQYREQLVKATSRSGRQLLTAPAAGTITSIGLHTIGGTVEAYKPVMRVVPDGSPLVVEARLLNRDAGFVHRGDPVTVKVDAYPFTDYGTVPGKVETITSDTVEDEKRGAVYVVRVRLAPAADPRSGALRLVSGMTVSADIKTGRRSILAYFLDPIRQAAAGAGREH